MAVIPHQQEQTFVAYRCVKILSNDGVDEYIWTLFDQRVVDDMLVDN